jgi:hypothetical protein
MTKQWKNEDIIYPEDAQRWEDGLEQAQLSNTQNATNLVNHADNKANPHRVTAAQTGAYTKSEADTKDAAVLATAKEYTTAHSIKKDNPHGVTAAQIGAYTKTEVDEKEAATVSTAKAYTDTKKVEAIAYTDQKIAATKSEIQAGSVNSATKLQTARRIAGVEFDGTKDISIPANNVGAYTKTETDSKIATTKSDIVGGNVASATKLQTARTINGVSFDGTSNIVVAADPDQKVIPNNTNLDTLVTPGFYTSHSDGQAGTMTNTPFGSSTFTLQVETGLNNTRIVQTAKRPSNGDVAIRYKTESTSWSNWIGLPKNNGTVQSGLFAQTASKLSAARTITLSGSATGSVGFDGTKDVTIGVSIADNSHKHTVANVTGLQANLDGKTNVRGHSNTTVTQISNTNLNDLAESGTFMGSTMTNAPDTGWWYIQNMVHNANYITQVAYRLNSTDQKIRIRIKNNGTWQGWQTFALSTDTAPAATKLATARTISLTGGVTGSTSFDGSGNAAIATTIAGNAPSATKLQTARTVAVSGAVTGSVAFNGSSNVTIATTPGSTVVNTTGAQTINGVKNFSSIPQVGGVNLVRTYDTISLVRDNLTGTLNWNSIVDPGIYWVSNITNKPNLLTNYGYLEVITKPNTSANVCQRFTDTNSRVVERFKNSSGWTKWNLVAYDSGWQTLTYKSPFKNYNDSAGNACKIRRTNNNVEIRGVTQVSTNTATTDSAISMLSAYLTTVFRPDYTVYRIQQGTGKRTWLMTVYDSGQVALMRYGVADWNAPINTDHWLPFHNTWTVTYDSGID